MQVVESGTRKTLVTELWLPHDQLHIDSDLAEEGLREKDEDEEEDEEADDSEPSAPHIVA